MDKMMASPSPSPSRTRLIVAPWPPAMALQPGGRGEGRRQTDAQRDGWMSGQEGVQMDSQMIEQMDRRGQR